MDNAIIQRLLDPNADIDDLGSAGASGSSERSSAALPRSINEYCQALMPLVCSAPDDPDGLYVIIASNGVETLYELDSARVIYHIIRLNDEFTNGDPTKFLNEAGAKNVVAYLRSIAYRTADNRPVFKRLAYLPDDNEIWVDIAHPSGECVRVTAGGWTVEQPLHPLFVRHQDQRALPMPVKADDGEAAFTSMLPPDMNGHTQKLLLGALISFLIPPNFTLSFGYPVIHLGGDAGAGKTTLARLLKMLIDNEKVVTSAPPTKAENLYVVARRSHLLSFDNISTLPPKISDALCQISTGGTLSNRTFYTNREISHMHAHCPALLNGIAIDLNRQDLIDRTITIALKRINAYDADASRHAESRLPEVFGYLLTLLSRALRNYNSVKLDKPPRLATLAKVVAAAEPFGIPTPFVELLRSNQQNALTDSADEHPVVDALFEFLTTTPAWTGRLKDLLPILATKVSEEATKSPDWTATPQKLALFIRQRDQVLRAIGIDAAFGAKTETGRLITVKRLPSFRKASFDFDAPPF